MYVQKGQDRGGVGLCMSGMSHTVGMPAWTLLFQVSDNDDTQNACKIAQAVRCRSVRARADLVGRDYTMYASMHKIPHVQPWPSYSFIPDLPLLPTWIFALHRCRTMIVLNASSTASEVVTGAVALTFIADIDSFIGRTLARKDTGGPCGGNGGGRGGEGAH